MFFGHYVSPGVNSHALSTNIDSQGNLQQNNKNLVCLNLNSVLFKARLNLRIIIFSSVECMSDVRKRSQVRSEITHDSYRRKLSASDPA